MKKGFTLIELMVVILIVAILAAVAIPILRARIDAAKWSEGKAMMGTIATAIRAYYAEHGPNATTPTSLFGTANTQLGFTAADLSGTYFSSTDFTDPPTSACNATTGAVTFTITCTAGGGGAAPTDDAPTNPGGYILNQTGVFAPQ